MTEVTRLEAEWQSGELLFWQFQCPTSVDGFELREPLGGDLLSIRVGTEEQLVGAESVPLLAAAQFIRSGAYSTSPEEGWKLGPLALPAMSPGVRLQVRLKGFTGQLRPFGRQVGAPRLPTLGEAWQLGYDAGFEAGRDDDDGEPAENPFEPSGK